MLEAVLLAALPAMTPAATPQPALQRADPEREARAAAFHYESLLRRRAPYGAGGGGGDCDEIVGRFCFRFGDGDTPDPPPEPEHPDVAEARLVAIRAHRRWLAGDPADPRAAGALIRYLVEDDRAREAVSVARTHVWAAPGPTAWLFLGLALHETGDFAAAESAFDSARAGAGSAERDRLDDVGVLLERGESRRYAGLGADGRAAYNGRFWAFSDPSLRQAGNERRSAHYARHGWVRILAEAPRAHGMLSWGRDHEEIVLRYGLPRSRERVRAPAFRLERELNMIERYDPHHVTFVPAALLEEGLRPEPPPGARPAVERDTSRSAYAPVRLHRMRGLHAQVTRLPGGDGWTIRVDALLPPDTTAPAVPAAPEGLVVVLDSMGRELARAALDVKVAADSSTVARGVVAAPPDAWALQVEVADDSTGLAGRWLHPVTLPAGPLALSDPLIGTAVGAASSGLIPFPSRVIAPGEPVAVYAEARGLLRVAGNARYDVEWWFAPVDRGTLLGRAARWVGRGLGLVEEDRGPVRVRWEAASRESGPVPIAFVVDLGDAAPGLYELGLRVRDRVAGREATTVRTLRLDPNPRWARPNAGDRD